MPGPVQTATGKKQSSSSSLTITATFSAATTLGHTLTLLVEVGGALSVTTTVTDNGATGANVWTKIFDVTSTDQVQLWTCQNPAETCTVVTLTLSATAGPGILVIAEEQPGQYTIPATALGTDYNVAHYNGSLNPIPTAPITTQVANAIARSACENRNGTAPTGSAYTLVTTMAQTSGTLFAVATDYLDVAASGTNTAETWTTPSANIDTLTATWQLEPAGTGPTTAAFSGTGTLTVTPTPDVTETVAFGSTGTLAVTATPAVTETVAFGSTGTLAVTATPAVTESVAFSGTGTLNAHVAAASVAFSGTGTLRAVVTGAGGRWLIGAIHPGMEHAHVN